MSEYLSQIQKNIIIQVLSDTLMGREKKKILTDLFEIGWVDLYSDKKKTHSDKTWWQTERRKLQICAGEIWKQHHASH